MCMFNLMLFIDMYKIFHASSRQIIMLPAPTGLGVFTNSKSSIKAALPSYIFMILASIKSAQPTLETLATALHLPMVLQSILLLQSISFILQYATSSNNAELFSLLRIYTVTILTLLLLQSYIQNRSHKNGCLLTTSMKSHATLNIIAQTFSSVLLYQAYPTATLTFLSGSLIAILISAYFASIADVWYTVGSGQWQMCSLDSAGMILYFIVPAVMLYLRFLDRYSESVGGLLCGWLSELMDKMGLQIGVGLDDTLIFLLSVTTSIGVPIINALCPLGGYLFARAYTHGQPNTKKVAVCVNCADLQADTTALLESCEQSKAVLNIYATLEDMQCHSEALKELAEHGHYIALAPGSGKNNIEIAYDEYYGIFGEKAEWTFASPNSRGMFLGSSCNGRHPAFLRKARDLGMKVAYWSTLVEVHGAKLTEEQKSRVLEDVKDKNGGSIIYVTLGKDATNGSLASALSAILDVLKDFSVSPLSQVVKDDSTMAL